MSEMEFLRLWMRVVYTLLTLIAAATLFVGIDSWRSTRRRK
jgi:hypothetical protein